MKIKLICVGKIKEKYFTAAINEYCKRLQRYAKIEIIEVADEKAPENLSQLEKEKIIEKEGNKILQKITREFVIVTDIAGKNLSSEQLAAKFQSLANRAQSDIVVVIGGSLGLSPAVKARADFSLSFGAMTFPHQLMRVVLLEQIYRAFRINKGEPYHK